MKHKSELVHLFDHSSHGEFYLDVEDVSNWTMVVSVWCDGYGSDFPQMGSRYIQAYLKNDGSSHFWFGDEDRGDGYIYMGTGKEDAFLMNKIVENVYEYGKQNLQGYE